MVWKILTHPNQSQLALCISRMFSLRTHILQGTGQAGGTHTDMPSPQIVARSWWLLGANPRWLLGANPKKISLSTRFKVLKSFYGGVTLTHIPMVLLMLRTHVPTYSEFFMPFLLAFISLMPAYFFYVIYFTSLHVHSICSEGASSRITHWSVLLPCNSQIKSKSKAKKLFIRDM